MERRIFVEGLPCAGKSLLVKHLEQQGHNVVHELGRTINPNDFPGNGTTLDEILKIDDWFIRHESDRSNRTGVYDRSFLTHVTYAYAYGIYRGTQSFRPTVERYIDAIEAERLMLPDAITLIDIEPEESIERQVIRVASGRRPLDDFWSDIEFLGNLRRAYGSLLVKCMGIEVVFIDGHSTTEEKCQEVEPLLVGTANTDKVIDLDKYCEELS